MRTRRVTWRIVLAILGIVVQLGLPAVGLARSPQRGEEAGVAGSGSEVIATIPVGKSPHGLAVNPRTNRIYVANSGGSNVSVIDGESNAVVATLDFSDVANSTPSSVAVNPATDRVYVADSSSGTVYVVDGTTNARLAAIPNVGNVWQLAVNPATNKIYAAMTNALVVIDGATNAVIARNRIGNAIYSSVPSSVAVNPTTNRVYATTGAEGFVFVSDSQSNLGAGGILIPRYFASLAVNPTTNRIYGSQVDSLIVVDGQTNAVTGIIGLPAGSALGSRVAVNPTTNRIYVPVQSTGLAPVTGTLAVVDGNSAAVVATVPIGSAASEVAINPTTNRIYLSSASSNALTVVADSPGAPAAPVLHDGRYFSQTGFRIDADAIWDYFNRRGGIPAFGYPISRTFLFQGFLAQMFQRRIIQLDENGNPRLLNLLDPGLLPYTSFNGAQFPAVDAALVRSAPDATNQAAVLAFVRANAPDTFAGRPVNFGQTFVTAVTYPVAFPNGAGDPRLLPGFDLELWGMPTSAPAFDPANHNFVYQRFQRGIMMYDASCRCTQGILLADYLKSILTGRNLPSDLAGEAQVGPLYRQYDPSRTGWVRDPSLLPSTDLTNAFEPE